MRDDTPPSETRCGEPLPIRRSAFPCAPIESGRPGGLVRLGGALGGLAYRLDPHHRTIVERNLRFAYPEWTLPQVAAVSLRVFQNFGRSIMEVLQLLRMSRAEVLTRCVLTGEDHMHQALAGGRGAILVSAHLGNWELGLQFLACRFNTPIHLVVKSFAPRALNDGLNRVRTRFGNRIIDKKKAFPAMRKAIRAGGVVALMVDLSRLKQSVEVAFFGHRARASHAAALLATRCGATVLPVFCHRNAAGRIAIDLGPPLDFQRSHDLKNDLQRNTQLLTDRVEAAVRRHPDQYLWVQRRWKDYHPYLYPEYRPRPEHLGG